MHASQTIVVSFGLWAELHGLLVAGCSIVLEPFVIAIGRNYSGKTIEIHGNHGTFPFIIPIPLPTAIVNELGLLEIVNLSRLMIQDKLIVGGLLISSTGRPRPRSNFNFQQPVRGKMQFSIEIENLCPALC